MRIVADKVVKTIKTRILCSIAFFPENLTVYEITWENMGAIHATDDNIIRRKRFECWVSKARIRERTPII
jgi:hypothetical protein